MFKWFSRIITKTNKKKSITLNNINNNKIDFGFNINRPLKDKMYDFQAMPSKEILDFNDFLKKNVPQEKFIDLLNLISNKGKVPLFTADNKLMSIDRAHLTYFGARDIGKIIFSDIRLNDFR